ncbi:MAG: synthase subunit delta [Fluviicola sp.]|jgi:F-type H+-transporting ATPase subunit delta|uniref:ATP synthase F1 subunit delta n=1 Tax=Fluviicola sp. TaxID=1917219 RepID=UPI0026366C98|nr:ATP synthase F1 subunit delta [Fluviicola sp.]MDF3029319.1 synthase subunit delta [Fluviicola sp.]
MKISKSASRYAQALLDLAIEQNKLDAVAADMKYMATVCAENPELELMLQSPVVKADKKLSVLNAIFDQFDQLTNLFVDLIVKNGREAYLSQIASSFDVLLKAHQGIVPVTLISAQKLDDKVKKEIVSKVQASITGTVELTEKIDADLIGGFIVRMGDTQIDASVASQINKLKQRLTR